MKMMTKYKPLLANGSIEIRNEKKPIPQVLNPGEQAVYNKITDNTKVSDINLYMVTSWKEGKMDLPPDRNGRDSSTPVTPFQRKHHLTKQKNIQLQIFCNLYDRNL